MLPSRSSTARCSRPDVRAPSSSTPWRRWLCPSGLTTLRAARWLVWGARRSCGTLASRCGLLRSRKTTWDGSAPGTVATWARCAGRRARAGFGGKSNITSKRLRYSRSGCRPTRYQPVRCPCFVNALVSTVPRPSTWNVWTRSTLTSSHREARKTHPIHSTMEGNYGAHPEHCDSGREQTLGATALRQG